MACNLDVSLAHDANFWAVERVAFCDEDLRLHDVDARNHLCNRVLNLDTRVHFDKVVLAGRLVEQELYCTSGAVIYGLCNLDCVRANCDSLLVCQAKRRCELDNLLVASLDGAVTFVKVNDVAFLVAENLHFDVLRVFEVFFDKYVVDAECLRCFGTCGTELWKELFFASNDSHTTAAAACCCLQHYWVATLLSKFNSFSFCLNCFLYAWNCWNSNGVRYDLRLDLVAELVHHLSCRSDKFYACVCASLGEFLVLGKEAVSWVDCVNALCLRERDDFVDAQICANWSLALADAISLVGFRSEEGVFVFFRINRNRSDAELFASTENSNRDFASVSD